MEPQRQGQAQSGGLPTPMIGRRDLITPNPKLKLLDQVREMMRLKHYSIRTKTAYCDWIRRTSDPRSEVLRGGPGEVPVWMAGRSGVRSEERRVGKEGRSRWSP